MKLISWNLVKVAKSKSRFKDCICEICKAYVRLKISRKLLQKVRVGVQEVKSLGGHFACLCRGFEFYEVKKNVFYFSKRKWKYFYTFYYFLVKSLQKEQTSTNLLLWPQICRNKSAITPKWFNSLDTNSKVFTLKPEKIIFTKKVRLNRYSSMKIFLDRFRWFLT